MTFYMGIRPEWIGRWPHPAILSRRVLAERRKLEPMIARWVQDSGGFTELSIFGAWTFTPRQYVIETLRIIAGLGMPVWVSQMDWMCEPFILSKTGKTVAEHQRLTVDNFLELRNLAPEVPWLPVLQGWSPDDYFRCWEMFEDAGVDLRRQPHVALGSVCRRQGTREVEAMIVRLWHADLTQLHAFGFKIKGIEQVGKRIASADSASWSRQARYAPPLDGCTAHKNCASCYRYATMWRQRLSMRMAELDIRIND